MIILGIVLIVLGLLFNLGVLVTLGIILALIGVVLWVLGSVGHGVGGRRTWY